jgi:hypothetical protein
MLKAKYILIAVALVIATGALYALNEPGDYILVKNDTAIQRLGAMEPFMDVSMLPDTVPPYFGHPQALRFNNERFHLLTESPKKELLAFSAGEGDQWIGLLNVRERYMKFLAWGSQTSFLDITFAPDAEHLAYTWHGPDHRTKVMIIETPGKDVGKPVPTNTWFRTCRDGEKFRSLGWILPGDTTYSFELLDSLGNKLQRVDLPLHIDYKSLPDEMRRERKEPTGVIEQD